MADVAVPSAEKDRFTSLDTLALVRELRALVKARIDKAFDAPGDAFSITLRSPGTGKRELSISPGRYAALLPSGGEHSEELSPFAKELRRLLTGGTLLDVAEPGGERYLEIRFRRADSEGPVLLAVELFGTGNVLVAREGKVAAVLHPKTWAHRTVRVGAVYAPPPRRDDPWTLSVSQLEAALSASRTDRVSTLAARLAFGGSVAEELLARSGLAPNAPAPDEAHASALRIHAERDALLTEVGTHPSGYLYRREGVLVGVEPVPARRFAAMAGVVEELRPTFSEAADEFFRSTTPGTVAPPSAEEVGRATLIRQQVRQEAAVAALEGEAADLSARAEAIFAHYEEAERALTTAASGAEGERSVEVQLGSLRVPLLIGRPVRESAQALYDDAKRVQAKLAGARAALVETVSQLGRATEAAPRRAKAAASREQRRSENWFEKYRWFVSSEGALVIGGRDAASNERIVRRHLNPKDRYVHADIQGAASVVVKCSEPGAPPVSDVTMHEAGQWAVAFSKAWRAGLASATAFWVDAEQVSKTPASGEFVARGAFIVRGTKNVMRDLPNELGLGTMRYRGEELPCVAPAEALRSRGELKFLLTPDDERERGAREVALSEASGLSRTALQRILPAGGLAFRRA